MSRTDGIVTVSPERGSFNRFLGEIRTGFERIPPRTFALYGYAGVLVLGATAVVAALLGAHTSLGSPIAVALLAAVTVVAERSSIRLSAGLEASVSSLPLIFAAVVFGPLAAVVVGVAGLLSFFHPPYLRWVIWSSSRAIVAAAAGTVAYAITGGGEGAFASLIAAVVVAACVDAVGDLTFHSITPALRGTTSLTQAIRDLVPLQIASIPLHAPVIAVLAYAYTQVSPWSVVLFILPSFAAQRLFLLYRQQRDTANELGEANARLESANLSFATALVATLDARDRYTAGHSAAVAIYSRDIASRMGLSESDEQLVHLCGLVHDIGKIGLPVGLLEKPGPLTLDERRQMEHHAEIGARILAKVADYSRIAEIVRHHHERIDGHGYPDGLSGDDIPLLSRIIAVADAYNAMTSDRPYRDAMPSRVARLRLAQAVETQFDTSVVAAFEAILAGSAADYRDGQTMDFLFETQDPTPALAAAVG